ncbi:hypothetical protein PM3016_3247 [Paenibacillus mucilaginosus 3016]|uniref:Uncharacterized protein n=3 Tax=Paenibacillus mucilaginosus TaxID=61624 RepID=H6NFL6_9BACL|nr:hypothetical protein KNP414_03009 [Paenibacillus mucilaginosus KNP414]AFC30102.1 hypothetical protein PM3016_3247 [Paenibacillus mucilaginosus 3016]AFH62361.1 hypothetical protein B2K_16815 [Paenibacillus mucilaginosus K02]
MGEGFGGRLFKEYSPLRYASGPSGMLKVVGCLYSICRFTATLS